jgi:ribonuclease HII
MTLEAALAQRGAQRIAGVDEAGRGAWAGPLVAAAVMLPAAGREWPYRDSKTVSAPLREQLAAHAKEHALAWALGVATAAEVDALGPLQATHLAAHRALADLGVEFDGVIADYLQLRFADPQPLLLAPPRAESASASVAAASLLAKTHRDELMRSLAVDYPGYGFEQHKGYGVAAHRAALAHLGPCTCHRLSVRPVRAIPIQPGATPG